MSYYFNGTIDEVRVSNASRSSDWINQSYQMVENQGSFVSFGGEETNEENEVTFYINSTGGLVTKGNFQNVNIPYPSGNDDLIIKNSTGDVAGFIDGETGNMYFRGDLHYNSDF